MKYICESHDSIGTVGDSLEEAYSNYQDSGGDYEINDCIFYEVTEIKVEMKIIPKMEIKKKQC